MEKEEDCLWDADWGEDGGRWVGRRRTMRIEIGTNIIRDWVKEDAAALTKHANNQKIAVNLRDRFPYPYTLSDAKSFLNRITSEMPRTVFAIATKTEAIGSIGLMMGQDVHRFTAELGYWLAEPYWGQGIMTSAVIAITEFGFRELGLNRIYAEPYASNPASVRVLEKAGFEFEGRLCASVVKNGKVLDQLMYAKVREGIK